MANDRLTYRFPKLGVGFKGEFNAEGATDERYQVGYLRSCRNYHIQGLGRLQKRRGHREISATLINGAYAIQGLSSWRSGSTYRLLVVSNGKLKWFNGTDYTDVTGSLTLGTGADNRSRFTQFNQGDKVYTVGTGPNSTGLWKWDGTNAATGLYAGQPAGAIQGPAYATDVCEFRGRIFALGTDAHPSICEYSNDGVLDNWDDGQYFYCSRRSPGMALIQHNDGVLLVFHQESIHRIEFNYVAGEVFTRQLVDGSVGTIATNSVCNSKGETFFVGPNGPYRIRDATRKAEFIGYPIKEYWAGLNQTRLKDIVGFERGGQFNEVVFLVSVGTSTTHNAALVYNTEQQSWSIFESESGYLKFSYGVDHVNSDGRHITMCGRYDGKVSECWGSEEYETGYMDGGTTGAAVASTLQTGDLDFGYRGLKRLREIWLDMLLNTRVDFTVTVTSVGGTTESNTASQSIGNPSGRLSVDFAFDVSAFGSGTSVQASIDLSLKARMFQFAFTESSEGPPHTINSLVFLYLQRSLNFKAIV